MEKTIETNVTTSGCVDFLKVSTKEFKYFKIFTSGKN